jgi:hypothetical protein
MSNETKTERPMDAVERLVLEWLSDRPRSAVEVATLEEWLRIPGPKLQAAAPFAVIDHDPGWPS